MPESLLWSSMFSIYLKMFAVWSGVKAIREHRWLLCSLISTESSGGSRITPRWGANFPGGANIWFCQIFPKTAWNWKNLDPGGPRPLRSATGITVRVFFSLCTCKCVWFALHHLRCQPINTYSIHTKRKWEQKRRSVNRQTHTTENITFPTTSLAASKKLDFVSIFARCEWGLRKENDLTTSEWMCQ